MHCVYRWGYSDILCLVFWFGVTLTFYALCLGLKSQCDRLCLCMLALPYQEEVLFNYPVSTYPDVDVISSQLGPFLRLFNVVLKWQRAEKKYVLTPCFTLANFLTFLGM